MFRVTEHYTEPFSLTYSEGLRKKWKENSVLSGAEGLMEGPQELRGVMYRCFVQQLLVAPFLSAGSVPGAVEAARRGGSWALGTDLGH